MITSYYNTTKEKGKQLAKSEAKAYTQAEAIMDIFFDRQLMNMTPADVWHIYRSEFKEILLSSVRARITSLTDKGKLVKTDKMREGLYGKPEYCWRYATSKDTVKQLELL